MNGPEHFKEAQTELCGDDTSPCEYGCPQSGCVHEIAHLMRAQVHATLALVAAVAELQSVHLGENRGGILSRGDTDTAAWQEVLSP